MSLDKPKTRQPKAQHLSAQAPKILQAWHKPWPLMLWMGFLSMLLVGFSSPLRTQLRHLVQNQERQVLAIATGSVLSPELQARIVKVRSAHGIFIEIYGSTTYTGYPIMGRILLPQSRDGYFHIHGQASNLALKDLNNDQVLEIIVPSFDNQLNPYLNVYSYNPKTNQFAEYTP